MSPHCMMLLVSPTPPHAHPCPTAFRGKHPNSLTYHPRPLPSGPNPPHLLSLISLPLLALNNSQAPEIGQLLSPSPLLTHAISSTLHLLLCDWKFIIKMQLAFLFPASSTDRHTVNSEKNLLLNE